jgi:hypothetical protein
MLGRVLMIALPSVIVLAAATLVLWKYGGFDNLTSKPPADPCPVDAPDGEVRHDSTYADKAAPYAGPGPHPVVMGPAEDFGLSAPTFPAGWGPGDDPLKAQLVVCEYFDSTGPVVDTCVYEGGHRFELAQASYVYRVFEARTAKPVTEFTLHASDGGCSEYAWVSGEGSSEPEATTYMEVFSVDLENALRPFVEPARP